MMMMRHDGITEYIVLYCHECIMLQVCAPALTVFVTMWSSAGDLLFCVRFINFDTQLFKICATFSVHVIWKSCKGCVECSTPLHCSALGFLTHPPR